MEREGEGEKQGKEPVETPPEGGMEEMAREGTDQEKQGEAWRQQGRRKNCYHFQNIEEYYFWNLKEGEGKIGHTFVSIRHVDKDLLRNILYLLKSARP